LRVVSAARRAGSILCAKICRGEIGWPSVDAAYFAEIVCLGLPI